MTPHLVAGLLAMALAGLPVGDPDLGPALTPAPTPALAPALALSPAPTPASGAGAFHLEFRAGIGTGEYHGSSSASNRSAGANWGIRMGFRPLEQLVLSLGYGQSSFGCDGGLCAQSPVTYSGSGIDVEAATDWRAVRFGAGLTRQILGAEWADVEGGRLTSVSAPSIGWFTAMSVDVPVSRRFSVAPGVRYMRHGTDFGSGDSRTTVQMMGDVGIRYRLPSGR
jgi:hypothetical protein